MRKYRTFFAIALALLLMLASNAHAAYWFQSGARGAGTMDHNNGASVEIQTIAPQNINSGSMAFWVGETLSNGAFLQVGYTVSNETGELTTNCTPGGCSENEFIKAGHAAWFYEYFKPGENETFYGNTGPDDSAGLNGTFHSYSFYSKGSTWYFLFDNRTVGNANLGASNSGPFQPVAVGEIANTSNAREHMKEVIFANLSAYKYGTLLPVEEAYGTVNYGVGSSTNLGNPYGVEEVGTRVNYFEVGSGLPTYTNGTRLWNLGYRLTLNSQYGGISSRDTYAAYSTQIISAPQIMNVSNGARALFTGWTGSGFGSYTGPKNNTQLMLTANVTETANWQLQYFVNVASSYGITSGSGWYNSSSTASYSISNTSFSRGAQEFRFFDWSNGNNATGGDVQVNAPFSISALWQYKANFIPEDAYGREISASYLLVDGVKTNSTPFLDTGKVSRVTGVYYKNMLLPTSVNMSEGSPPLESIPLPVYNISVKTLGLLEIIPVNASALIKFRNGTVLSTYMGPRGVLNITDVPEGYANVTLRYLGMEQNVLIQGGGGKTVLFLTFVNMLGLLLLIYFGSYLLHRHRVKRLAAAEKQG